MKPISLIITVFILLLCACKKSSMHADGKIVAGVGCSQWLIQLNDSSVLQPTNLSTFHVSLTNGQDVSIAYQKSSNQLSICQDGLVVDLLAIEEK